MTDTKSRRFSIQISSDNQCLQSVYDYMTGSRKGLRSKVLEACESYYYPLALMDSNTDPDEILDAAIAAVNQLHQQIQFIVEKVQQQGIQPTPLMLAKAGIVEYATPVKMPSGSAANPISTPTADPVPAPAPITSPSASPSSPQTITEKEIDDDDDWGEDPPVSEARLAYIRDSKKEQGIDY